MTEKPKKPVTEIRRRFTYVKKEELAQLGCDILNGRFPHRWTPQFDVWRAGFWDFLRKRHQYDGPIDRWLGEHKREWEQAIIDYCAQHPAPDEK